MGKERIDTRRREQGENRGNPGIFKEFAPDQGTELPLERKGGTEGRRKGGSEKEKKKGKKERGGEKGKRKERERKEGKSQSGKGEAWMQEHDQLCTQ